MADSATQPRTNGAKTAPACSAVIPVTVCRNSGTYVSAPNMAMAARARDHGRHHHPVAKEPERHDRGGGPALHGDERDQGHDAHAQQSDHLEPRPGARPTRLDGAHRRALTPAVKRATPA